MNPCPCGYASIAQKRCDQCDIKMAHYQAKLSGPLLDRIDLHVHVGALSHRALAQQSAGEPSHLIRQRVLQAQQRQLTRQGYLNDQLDNQALLQHARLPDKLLQRYAQACDKLLLSTRAFHRIWHVARTIADMADQDQIDWPQLQEALHFRSITKH
jgi:magnesium chelatase family protein